MRLCQSFGLALLVSTSLSAAVFNHSVWDRVLKTYVNEIGEVDYAALKANRKDLDEYIRMLGESSPVNRPELFPTKEHELAYWMNAYNGFVIRGVVDQYPTRNVRGTFGRFFFRKTHTAGGVKMSLQHLEHKIIRKQYNEPRMHFGIVCAAISCPILSREAFTAENLEEHLEQLTRQFVNEQRNFTISPDASEVTLSKIYDWYTKDFEYPEGPGGPKQTLLDYVRRYANDENRKALDGMTKTPKVRFYGYDWAINEPGAREKATSPLEREFAKRQAKDVVTQ